MDSTYRYIDHTADLGIEVYGETLGELFINIGKAIFETQISGRVAIKKKITIELSSESIEDLFIDWCRELLYHFSVHGFIPQRYEVSIRNTSLTAQLTGDIFDHNRHTVRMEIKNPTYHNLSLTKTKEQYRATIIFDV